MKKKHIIILSSVAVVAIILIIVLTSNKKDAYKPQVVKAQKGLFEIIVTTTGELEAESNIKIEAPTGMRARNVRLGEIKIQDLVPEGTVVRKGDYVAMLDRTSADNSLKDLEDEYEALQGKYDRTLLDTSLTLKGLRDDIENQKFNIEEARIAVEQSIYEPPATQRQYLNNLEKAERSHEQSLNNYDLKVEQAQATVNDVLIELNRKRRQLDELREVLSNFTIYAPTDGMVIYFRDWSGEKRRIGSSISGWDLVVATLPDLSNMLSKTYVNEIDISKVKPGQLVRKGVDAFPEKSYTGVVKEVSNIGEQLKNADAKVFEVIIKVDGEDEILRPAMTTSNKIITASLDSAVFVPSETIFERDSITYVYKTNGTRQVVVKGPSNENFTVIERGLQAGDELYLSLPQNPTRFKLQGEELIPIIKNRLKKEAEEQAEAEKKKAEQEKGRGQRRMTMTPGVRPEGMTPGTPPANMQPGTPPANVQQKKAE